MGGFGGGGDLINRLLQFFGLLAPGNILLGALRIQDLAALVEYIPALIIEPDHPSIAGKNAVFQLERFSALIGSIVFGQHALPIFGMQQSFPQARLANPLFRRIAQNLLDLRTDIEHAGFPAFLHNIRNRIGLFYDRAEFFLGIT